MMIVLLLNVKYFSSIYRRKKYTTVMVYLFQVKVQTRGALVQDQTSAALQSMA